MTTVLVLNAKFEFNVKTVDGEVDSITICFEDKVLKVPENSSPQSELRAKAWEAIRAHGSVWPKGEWIPFGEPGTPEFDCMTQEEVADLLEQAESSLYTMRLYRDLLEEGP